MVPVERYLKDELVRKIMANARIAFATLVWIEKLELLKELLERHPLLDQRLPLSLSTLEGFGATVALDFYQAQWMFLAVKFTRGFLSIQVDSNSILPFLKDEKVGGGSFGTVYEISLDAVHQELEDGFSQRLVRKELNHDDHSVELHNLGVLSHLNHPNIIRLLGSYRYKERSNLLFPFAEGGDLACLFKKKCVDTAFRSDEAFLVALAGLASALEHVHEFVNDKMDLQHIGCHYDFRPKNILVSEKALKLADFGLSKFKEPGEDSKTMFRPVNDCYLAPECEDLESFKKSRIGRSSDIWSFGCIITELLVYMKFGPEGVEQFKKSRAFKRGHFTFALFHWGSQPNPAVERWLSKSSIADCPKSRGLAALAKRMMSLKEAQRPKAKQVTACLRFIVISEVVETIDGLFESISVKGTSLDIFLQLMRFDAWKHGIGVVDYSGVFLVQDFITLDDEAFNLMLQDLNNLRDHLNSTSNLNTKALAMGNIRALAQLNDRLENLLNKQQQDRARSYFSSKFLESKFSESVDQIRDDLSLAALGSGIKLRAALKKMTELSLDHSKRDNSHRQIQRECVKDLKPAFSNHDFATLSGETSDVAVLVEWHNYSEQEADDVVIQELFTRIECMADLMNMEKPEGFCSLPCRGFFHDQSKFGFGMVYDLPPHSLAELESRPVTLKNLIKNTRATSKQPILDVKFRLASTLANALLEFHMVGWLHKDLTPSNIIFCPRTHSPISDTVEEPYIIGFNHSRPDEITAFTSGPSTSGNDDYQHPQYRQDKQGYRQEYDYYSLGVVLLEIGFWKTLDNWTENWSALAEEEGSVWADEIKKKLLDTRVPLLGQYMGSSCREAVEICLNGEFGVSEALDEREKKTALQDSFIGLVVDRLRKPAG